MPRPVQIWAAVGPLLAPSLSRGDGSMAEIIDAVETGHAQLWIAHEGEAVLMAGVTTVGERACHVWHLGGKQYRRWLTLATETLKAAARERGCTKITIDGRNGWRRLLAPFGAHVVGDGLEIAL